LCPFFFAPLPFPEIHNLNINNPPRPCTIVDMGRLEEAALLKRRKGYIQNALLSAIGISGLLAVGILAPNTLQIIGKLGRNKHKFNYQIKSVSIRLVRKGLARFVERNGRKYLELTTPGREVLASAQQRAALLQRASRRWDGRWRMIIFDIPEKYRKTRDKLRGTLRSLGFIQLQGSVWVYPYDCEEVVALVKSELHVGASVLYTIVEKIESDGKLRQHFKLR
jgi:transposase